MLVTSAFLSLKEFIILWEWAGRQASEPQKHKDPHSRNLTPYIHPALSSQQQPGGMEISFSALHVVICISSQNFTYSAASSVLVYKIMGLEYMVPRLTQTCVTQEL